MSRRVLSSPANPASKFAAAGITLALVAAVAVTNVYLPYFSPEAVSRREAIEGGMSRPQRNVPGSTWSNVTKQRDAGAPPPAAAR
jgi:hypothetical protein